MRPFPRRVAVALVLSALVAALVSALVAVLGLVAPAGPLSWLAAETAAAASLPQPGKHGQTVWALQQRLIKANLLRAQYNTGYYGSKTKKAVKKLQKSYHLKATRRMTKATDRALTRAVAKMTGPRTW